MINILIIDDLEDKIKEIRKILLEGCGLDENQIDTARSIASGRSCLANKSYDILLLDLYLPMFDNEDPQEGGGVDFLKEINGTTSINMPTQIIGLTEREDEFCKDKPEFDNLLFSIIQRKPGMSDWIKQLKTKIDFTIRSKETILKSLADKNRFDIGIICALNEEFSQLMAAFSGQKWSSFNVEGYPYQFKSTTITTANMEEHRIVAACVGRPGVTATSILATTMFTILKVNYLFMTGFSAGIPSKDIKLGDLIIAKSVQDYAVGKLYDDISGNTKLLKEVQQMPGSAFLIAKAQDLLTSEDYMDKINAKIRNVNLKVEDRDMYVAHVSPTVCGPFVVTSPETIAKLKADDRKLQGLDMEGFGLYSTSYLLHKNALWIKGVADLADGNKGDAYHKTCSFSSALFLYWLIKDFM